MDSGENSTTLLGMPTYPDRSSSLWLDPHLIRRVSQLRCRLVCPSSVANCHFSVPLSHSLTGVPSLLPVTPRSQVQNPLSGFAPKQTKESSAWRTTYIVLHLTIRLFRLISRTLVGGGLPLCREAVRVFYSPSRVGKALNNLQWLICHKTKPNHSVLSNMNNF